MSTEEKQISNKYYSVMRHRVAIILKSIALFFIILIMANCQDCKWYKNCYAGCNASCHLSGSITKKSEFECYFINNIFNNIKNQLADLKLNKLNPYARRIIEENIEIDF